MTTWFASFLAYVLGIKTLASFIFVHLSFAVLSVYLLYRYVTRYVDREIQSKAILLFAILPVLSTVFYWIGMDSFTFLLMVIFLNLKSKPTPILFLGIIGGLHHFEIIFVSVFSLVIYELFRARALRKNRELLMSLLLLIGVVIGKILLIFIFNLNNVLVTRNRISIGLSGINSNIELFEKYGFLIYYSMLGPIWIVLIIALFKRSRDSFALLSALIVPFVVVLFVRDSSRVIQLTSFLSVAIGLLSNKELMESLSNKVIKIVLLIWLITPWIWIWQKSFGSVTAFTFKYIHSRLFESDLAPWVGNIFMWPFS
jgi:hypothetical protein